MMFKDLGYNYYDLFCMGGKVEPSRLLKKGFFSKDEGNWHAESDDIHRNWKTYAYYIENMC